MARGFVPLALGLVPRALDLDLLAFRGFFDSLQVSTSSYVTEIAEAVCAKSEMKCFS
jgi:hypothetical protein